MDQRQANMWWRQGRQGVCTGSDAQGHVGDRRRRAHRSRALLSSLVHYCLVRQQRVNAKRIVCRVPQLVEMRDLPTLPSLVPWQGEYGLGIFSISYCDLVLRLSGYLPLLIKAGTYTRDRVGGPTRYHMTGGQCPLAGPTAGGPILTMWLMGGVGTHVTVNLLGPASHHFWWVVVGFGVMIVFTDISYHQSINQFDCIAITAEE